ncbi:OLC1v1021046C1 [Oldenlandia corymbosa var. corymbosa]|uniref:OLC1v1021046C1 n=1 Tax=Oldenlandia corymbosa var. corymbosa TaxID=529605 RepID=A0AAV1BX22_OLDCO|nr:OLC1v1021046C1 [Oldenlandia corymbosa var. corymbosa]
MAQLARPTLGILSQLFHYRHSTFIFRPPSRLRLRTFHSVRPILSDAKQAPIRFGFGSVPHPPPPQRNLSVRAANGVDESGAVDSNLIQSMEKKIKEHLSAESVIVTDAYGDGRHVSIDVVSAAFEGQSAVNRQRMVYKAIWEELQNTVHAVDQMITKTPGEAEATK